MAQSSAQAGAVWQWEEDGLWKDYDAQQSQVIEAAFTGGLASVNLRIGAAKTSYHVGTRLPGCGLKKLKGLRGIIACLGKQI